MGNKKRVLLTVIGIDKMANCLKVNSLLQCFLDYIFHVVFKKRVVHDDRWKLNLKRSTFLLLLWTEETIKRMGHRARQKGIWNAFRFMYSKTHFTIGISLFSSNELATFLKTFFTLFTAKKSVLIISLFSLDFPQMNWRIF